jgi:ABC-type nitrate/sulfonate/bicarbonate transport system substrate-binding protein
MRCHRLLRILAGVMPGMLLYEVALGLAQERPTLLAGHGTLSGSTAAMRPYLTKQPARMRSFVAGVTESIAYIRRRPTEAKRILQKYTRVSDPTILQHAYDSDTRYMEALPRPTPEGTKTILENFRSLG